MNTAKVSIKRHRDVRRAKQWRVRWRDIDHKRKTHFFATEAEAEVYAEHLRSQILNSGLKALSLPDDARREAAQALELLGPYDKGILDAAKFYAAHLERTAKSCTIQELLESFLCAKEKVSPGHLSDMRNRLKRFCTDFTGRTVNTITAGEVADWIHNLPVGDQTKNNFRRVLHNMFNFALVRKLVSENPVKATPPIKLRDADPEIYTPQEMALLLEHADPKIVPYLALGAFAGLRGAERERLQWQNIELKTGYIRVGGDIAKTKSKRLIPISGNLRNWLLPYARLQGRILPVEMQHTFRDLIHRACEKAGVKWKHNGLRHSFASYRLAQTGDAARTSLEMGNSPAVVFKHYRELVSKEQADTYWSIQPVVESKVIPMTQAVAA